MSSHAPARRWTYEEFARLPDDGNRHEIIAGELCVTPAPRPVHQEIAGRLTELLRPFVKAHRLGRALPGPIDVLFAEGDYLEPDYVFIRSDRTHLISDRGIEGAPDLVVEIVSPGTTRRDRGLKRQRYAHFGVAEYWILDPRTKRVEIHRSTDDPARQTEIASGTFDWQPVPGGPTLTVDVAELLRDWDTDT